MKTVLFSIFFWTLCFATMLGQNSIKIYPYPMTPSEHPDYSRHLVQSPDASLFENKTEFIALRDLTGNYNEKLDLWINKDKLGKILWVSYPFIYQENIKEIVSEIKRRGLYLFDLWGYVPGSGPGGYWKQFVLPDSISSLFETELGNRWLGMDNGEQDGRYVGSYAPHMYPMGVDRKQQYLNFQRHFEEMGNQLGNKMSTLVSLNFGHYFLKEGVYALIGAETAQGLPNSQIYYSFIRGAGKQYGVSWFGNASVWNRWGFKTYDKDATNIDEDYNSGGPLKGTSLSLLKRLMYNHLMYDCLAVGFEGSMRVDNEKLSPIGKIQQSAAKWVDKYGDPGIMYTPVAVMVDFFSGWTFPRHLYSRQAYKLWGNLPYEKPNYFTDGVLDLLYPGYQDASYYKDERGFIAPTPYGDIADCLMTDAPLWVLKQYPVLIIADEIQRSSEINDKLETYVKDGGHLVITSASLKNMPNGIAGICVGKKAYTSASEIEYNGDKIQETAEYNLLQLKYPSCAKVIQWSDTIPVTVELNSGKGMITVFASPFGITDQPQCELPALAQEEQVLAKPFPVLNHVKVLLNNIFSSVQLFSANPALSMITCYKGNNEYTVLISNDKWYPQKFHIGTKTGKIASIKELETDLSEMKAVGFTPKIVRASIGKNTHNTIAGGSVRIFKVNLQDADISVMPKINLDRPKHKISLVLRNTLNIKEEILKRPTFFEHYDRVVVDWRYLYNKEKNRLQQEGDWINRQKLKVSVDLTSGINLFPDLRIVNNDELPYKKSMAIIKNVMDKMSALGADVLLLSTQQTIENNFTPENFNKSLRETFIELADYAKEKNIQLFLKQVYARTPSSISDLKKLVDDVNRGNFTFSPSLALLLLDEGNIRKNITLLKQMKIENIVVSGTAKDIHQQLWNTSYPLYKYQNKEKAKEILKQFPNVEYIMDGIYASPDEEYLDVKNIHAILAD